MTDQHLAYDPDYATPPGASLRSTLAMLEMTQADLAARAGLSLKHVNQMAQGNAPLTPESALLLEKVTGVPARIWNALEARYRERLVRADDKASLAEDKEWLKELPIAELVKRGIVTKGADHGTQLQEVCSCFGVANRESWERVWREPLASFRQSRTLKSNAGAVAAWLRLGELKAKGISSEPYDSHRFRDSLQEIRTLTVSGPDTFLPVLTELCLQAGVVVVFVPEIPGARCWGAARWLTPTKALIQLSLRYKTDDHLWFSLFHESGHLLLHGKKGTFIAADRYTDIPEEEADSFASSFLIPRQYERRLRALRLPEVPAFARELGIAPGIVVGRLQKEGLLDWNQGNTLKKRFEFVVPKSA
jgi:HTH-type transcriptional regulator/antitoxin HigA